MLKQILWWRKNWYQVIWLQMYPRACSTVREEGLTELKRTEDMGQRSAHDSLKLKSAISSPQLLNLRVCCITCASDTTVYRHKFITSKQWRKQGQHLSFHSLDAENKPYTSEHGDSNYRHVIFWTILTSLKRAKMFTFYFSNCIMASKIVFEILR